MSAVFFVSAWTLIVVDLRPHYTPFQVFVHFRILIISQVAVVMCTLCTSRLTFRPRVLLLTNVQFGRTNSPFWLGLLRSCTRFNPWGQEQLIDAAFHPDNLLVMLADTDFVYTGVTRTLSNPWNGLKKSNFNKPNTRLFLTGQILWFTMYLTKQGKRNTPYHISIFKKDSARLILAIWSFNIQRLHLVNAPMDNRLW